MKINTFSRCLAITSVTILLGLMQNVDASIYKCVNAQGETYYNDKACPKTDKETQLDNIKDPVGGYIPPAFKADAKVQGSKGVVVGGNTDSDDNNKRVDDVSDSENLSNTKGSNNSSDSNESNANSVNENVIESSYSGSGKRTKPKGASKKPLPTIPLKVERVTLEPRSKLN